MAGPPCVCSGKVDGICTRVRVGEPFVRGRDCAAAWHWHHTSHIRAAWGGSDQPSIANQAAVKKVASVPACSHLGKRLPGQPCGSTLMRCDLHGDVTTRFTTCKGTDRCCNGCPDYTGERPWHADSAEFLRTLPPYPHGKWSGRGVVIAGGGPYWPSVYVTVRMLRHVGCTLPVEVWHLAGEKDTRYESLLTPFGVTFQDADKHLAKKARRTLRGFGVKLFAVVNSSFEEVLSLDADNYPCQDPTVLFGDQRYIERGGVYWPDIAVTNGWTRWPHWGVEKFGPDCGFETGQFVLHKRKAYEPMMLAEWYDDRPEHCYGPETKGDHGDKGPHRVAWARLRREPVVFNPTIALRSFAFIQAGPDGKTPMFVHRTRSKFAVGDDRFTTTPQHGGTNQRASLPLEEVAFGYLDELRKVILSTSEDVS